MLFEKNIINYKDLEIGNYAFSDYTKEWYVIACLPEIVEKTKNKYALVRLDGSGYYYLSDTLDEVKYKISMDGGETTIYKNLSI